MPKSWPLGSHGCDTDTNILKMVSGSIMISYHTQQPLPQVPVLIHIREYTVTFYYICYLPPHMDYTCKWIRIHIHEPS
jgi:hypothetical protein